MSSRGWLDQDNLKMKEDFRYDGLSRQDWLRRELIDLYLYQMEQKYGPITPEPEDEPDSTLQLPEFTKKVNYGGPDVVESEFSEPQYRYILERIRQRQAAGREPKERL